MSERSELDEHLGPKPSDLPLGVVVGGSLSTGLTVKIHPAFTVEKLAVGRYVVIRGRQTDRTFFGIITDIGLDATDADLARRPPMPDEDFSAEVLSGEIAYGTMHVSPMLMLDEDQDQPRPVKTIPGHFSAVFEASAKDVDRVFGTEDKTHFYVGTPLDMESVQVNLDLARFIERSAGVFGKSGTGKSFITRTVLAGIIRSGDGLEEAARKLAAWQKGLEPGRTHPQREKWNTVLVGRLLVEAALLREESRGAHYRSDFPQPSPSWQRHIIFRRH